MAQTILIVDDEPLNLDLLEQELGDLGYDVERASDGKTALEQVERQTPDLVLLDYQMPGMNGIEVLTALRQSHADLPVIIITAYGTIERAVEAIKAGASDFITKPFDPEHLALVLRKSLERVTFKSELDRLHQELGNHHRLVVGTSPVMQQLIEEARKAAASKATILLLGDSGTGKELFARSVHQWSDRAERPFVPINCVGLSRELLESELFGHERGAFTGAHQMKKGKFELAHGGTIFLDEVGDISAELQTKLLRFLQEREFERVGGVKPINVDVRIIAATNRNLASAVSDGSFREDLYHRLNVIAFDLPPLRQRKEDLSALANYFLQRFANETKKPFTGITPAALTRLEAYDWPGNVRELANVIERGVVLGDGPNFTEANLPSTMVPSPFSTPLGNAESYHDAVAEFRKTLIVAALNQAHGNRAAAAKALGLHRTHFMKLLRALQIDAQ